MPPRPRFPQVPECRSGPREPLLRAADADALHDRVLALRLPAHLRRDGGGLVRTERAGLGHRLPGAGGVGRLDRRAGPPPVPVSLTCARAGRGASSPRASRAGRRGRAGMAERFLGYSLAGVDAARPAKFPPPGRACPSVIEARRCRRPTCRCGNELLTISASRIGDVHTTSPLRLAAARSGRPHRVLDHPADGRHRLHGRRPPRRLGAGGRLLTGRG